MKDINLTIADWFLAKKQFIWAYSVIIILSGIIYIILEFINQEFIKDSLFIGLLFGGSFILLLGVQWIQAFFIQGISLFYENLNRKNELGINEFRRLLERIFRNPLTIISGILYGLIIGSVPFVLNVWNDEISLKVSLSLFLFVVNFLTGASLFSLIMLFVFLYRTSKFIIIGLYDRYNAASIFVTELSKRASIIASLYVAFSITSIYFSELPINTLIIGYSVFAGIIIIFAYIVPMIPIRNKVQFQKKQMIREISCLLQNEFNQLVNNAKHEKSINLKRYNSLNELKTKISGIQTFPIGFKAVWNSIYIIMITLLPVLVQVVLEKIINN